MIANLFGEKPDEDSINIIQTHEPPEGYYLAFSGGKDSVVLLDLARRAGVRFDAHYNVTTIDPPELTRFIKTNHPEVEWDMPQKSFCEVVRTEGLPTRLCRFCCRYLKEYAGDGRKVLTGIRLEESPERKKQYSNGPVSYFRNHGITKWLVNPILDWTEGQVWDYIRERRFPYCKLYDEGWSRLGCVPCPYNRKVALSMQLWPGIWRAVKRAAFAYWATRELPTHNSPEEYWEWWIARDVPKGEDPCQIPLFI